MKKLLTLTLSLLMAFSMCLTISADNDGETTYVAQIEGGDKYETIQAAIDAAKSGDKITILKNVENIGASNVEGVSASLYVSNEKNITIDLNGKTISTAEETTGKHYYILKNYGTLVLEDSIGTGSMNSRGIDNYGTLTINSGTYASIDSGNGGASVWNNPGAKLIINGGILSVPNGENDKKDGAQCIYNQYGDVKIYGGTITSNSTVVYAIISVGDLTISPAEGKTVYISGQKGGIGIDSGNVVINGGTSISGDYYGIYISDDGYKNQIGKSTVVINDCNFDGKKYSVYIGTDKNRTDTSTLEINGGTYNKPIIAADNTVENAITVKGGTFSADVTKYLVNGYNIAKVGEVYKVTKNGETLPVNDNTAAVEEGTVNTIIKSKKIEGLNESGEKITVDVNSDSTKIELESKPETLTTEEETKVESVKEEVKNGLKVDASKEEIKYIPLDITLTAINNDVRTKITDLGKDENEKDVEITVTIYLNEATLKQLKDKDVKVIRIHGTDTDILDAELTNNALTFKTGKFSKYVIAYSSLVSTNNTSTKYYDPKDKNQDGIITCDEEMNSANWVWSTTKNACVYKVSNTSAR